MENLKIRKWSLLAIAVLGSTPAMAEGLNYNYIEAAYVDTEIDDNSFDIDGDGIGLGGSVELGETMFLTAGYSAILATCPAKWGDSSASSSRYGRICALSATSSSAAIRIQRR